MPDPLSESASSILGFLNGFPRSGALLEAVCHNLPGNLRDEELAAAMEELDRAGHVQFSLSAVRCGSIWTDSIWTSWLSIGRASSNSGDSFTRVAGWVWLNVIQASRQRPLENERVRIEASFCSTGDTFQMIEVIRARITKEGRAALTGTAKAPRNEKPPVLRKPPRKPSKTARTAYRVFMSAGQEKPTTTAEILSKEWNKTIGQGQVSRWVNQVREWLKAGKILPDIDADNLPRPRVVPANPAKLDQGKRTDPRRIKR